jgi:hypothetical protein
MTSKIKSKYTSQKILQLQRLHLNVWFFFTCDTLLNEITLCLPDISISIPWQYCLGYKINGRENRMNNQEWTIQRKWQHWVHKTKGEDTQNKKHNTICVGHRYVQINTNNVNKA